MQARSCRSNTCTGSREHSTARGVPIYEATPVVEMTRARAAKGPAARAAHARRHGARKQVIVATNAYSDPAAATCRLSARTRSRSAAR